MSISEDPSILKDLVSNISGGDEKAFEKLYFLFSEKVYHIARKMNLSHEDAEGIVQEVFLRIWKNRSKLDPELSINAYLIAIVRSLVIKKLKREARFFAFQQYHIPLIQEVGSFGPDDEMIFLEFDQLTKEIINQLPTGQKQIFQMRYFENLSIVEISEKLSLSKRTVENQIYRATHTVKERLVKLKIISTGILFLVIDTLLIRIIE